MGTLIELFLLSNPGMKPPGFERVRRWYFKGEIAIGAVLRHALDMLLQPLLQ